MRATTVVWREDAPGTVLTGGIPGPYSSCPVATPLTVGFITGNRFVPLPALPDLSLGSFAW
jgi:hypothetical protein